MTYEIVYQTVAEGLDIDDRNRELRRLLGEHQCEVTFTKIDGTTRVMPCSLRSEDMLPKAVTEHHQTRTYNPAVLSVWCLDRREWRSFKVANVQKIRVLE